MFWPVPGRPAALSPAAHNLMASRAYVPLRFPPPTARTSNRHSQLTSRFEEAVEALSSPTTIGIGSFAPKVIPVVMSVGLQILELIPSRRMTIYRDGSRRVMYHLAHQISTNVLHSWRLRDIGK
jgi:hypothetical protein